jgi:hypothetical protein
MRTSNRWGFRQHVTLAEGIDRMYLNVYIPGLQANKVWPASFDFTADTSSPPAP